MNCQGSAKTGLAFWNLLNNLTSLWWIQCISLIFWLAGLEQRYLAVLPIKTKTIVCFILCASLYSLFLDVFFFTCLVEWPNLLAPMDFSRCFLPVSLLFSRFLGFSRDDQFDTDFSPFIDEFCFSAWVSSARLCGESHWSPCSQTSGGGRRAEKRRGFKLNC
jgi:hypothetical protein